MAHRAAEGVTVTSGHSYKNVAGFFGFVCLFVYCGALFAQGAAPRAGLFIALGMLAILFASIRSGRRLLLIRRLRMAPRR